MAPSRTSAERCLERNGYELDVVYVEPRSTDDGVLSIGVCVEEIV
jgi:hypothetical protein